MELEQPSHTPSTFRSWVSCFRSLCQNNKGKSRSCAHDVCPFQHHGCSLLQSHFQKSTTLKCNTEGTNYSHFQLTQRHPCFAGNDLELCKGGHTGVGECETFHSMPKSGVGECETFCSVPKSQFLI
jgi:hypothetical protein